MSTPSSLSAKKKLPLQDAWGRHVMDPSRVYALDVECVASGTTHTARAVAQIGIVVRAFSPSSALAMRVCSRRMAWVGGARGALSAAWARPRGQLAAPRRHPRLLAATRPARPSRPESSRVPLGRPPSLPLHLPRRITTTASSLINTSSPMCPSCPVSPSSLGAFQCRGRAPL